MTRKLLQVFPKQGGKFPIEPDASSGSYFVAAGQLLEPPATLSLSERSSPEVPTAQLKPVTVLHWPTSGWQMDENFPKVMERRLIRETPAAGRVISRSRDLGDSIMTAIAVAPLAMHSVTFVDLGRLRLQECERVFALRTELTRCGAQVREAGDTLEVFPSTLHGAEIETYNDHRMAMCFAILGLKVPGTKIKNPACVKKTFPNFFQKLAAPPPEGLGVNIRDACAGKTLAMVELFAD
jgi:3-phosphoshikimate 1-carboxyvinyltransferase